MKIEAFVHQVQLGLPKFTEAVHEYQRTGEMELDYEEEELWEQFVSWVSLHGVNPND